MYMMVRTCPILALATSYHNLPPSPQKKNSDLAGLDEAAGTALESWDQPSTCFFLLSAAVRLLFLAFHTVTPSSGVNYHH